MIRQKYWWFGINIQVKESVKDCFECQLPTTRYSSVEVDFCGPFPNGKYVLQSCAKMFWKTSLDLSPVILPPFTHFFPHSPNSMLVTLMTPVHATIVNREMVWKLGELQSVYNELRFNVETASPCTNLLKFC